MATTKQKDALAAYAEQLNRFKAVDEEKNDTISKLLSELEAAQVGARRASDDLEREQDTARRLQQRNRELEALMSRRGFALVLIDADADDYIFLERFLNRNEAGGKDAADEIYARVREYMTLIGFGSEDLSIIVRAYANIKDLRLACVRKRKMNVEANLNLFMHGFNQRQGLFDFVDVGPGKEEADNKIRENLNLYVADFQCKHVILGVCHDAGYKPYLSRFASDSVMRDRITLVEGGTMNPRIRDMGFPRRPMRLETVFSPKESASTNSQSVNVTAAQPQAPSAPQIRENPGALSDRLEPSRNENGQRIDKALSVDPEAPQYDAIRRAQLCGWYYLRGKCEGSCVRNHNAPALSAHEFDCLWHYTRQGVCYKIQKGRDCKDPKCIYGHHGE